MNSTQKKLLADLFEAAEMRLAGLSWEDIARKLHRSLGSCRQWPNLHRERWQRALREAEARLIEQAGQESLLCLRNQLRSKDETIVSHAAQTLLKERTIRLETAPEPQTEFQSQYAFLMSLNDDERNRLLEQLLAKQNQSASEPVAPPDADPSPPQPE